MEVGAQERLNCIQAAARGGVDIPFYCWHAGLTVVASCRMCLVETGTRNAETGAITMVPKLVPACQTPAKDGMVIVTDNDNVRNSRARVEEELADRPSDRLPDLRQSRRMPVAGLSFRAWPVGAPGRHPPLHQPPPRAWPDGHAVRRSLRDVQPLRAVCPRDQRHARVDGHQPRQPRGDRCLCPAIRWKTRCRATWSIFAPSAHLGDKDFLYKQRVWFMKIARRRVRRLLDGLLDPGRREPGHGLSAEAARKSVRQQVVDVRRRPLRLSLRA